MAASWPFSVCSTPNFNGSFHSSRWGLMKYAWKLLAPSFHRQTDRWLHDLLARAKSSTITHGTSLQIMLNLISTPHKNASIPSTAMRLNTNLNYQFNINSFKFTHKTIINSSSLVFCCFQQVSHMHSHLLSCLNLDLPETKSFNCPQSLPSIISCSNSILFPPRVAMPNIFRSIMSRSKLSCLRTWYEMNNLRLWSWCTIYN